MALNENAAAVNQASIFADTGQGGKWIEQFFPYNNPHLDGVHAAIGKMLAVYNTGILVLAGMLALWAIISFIIDSAHTGTVGGGRHNMLYGPLRLVVALGLLVPLGTGYNGAQVIALQLAEAGSGLANAVWKNFAPEPASYHFSQASFSSGNIDGFLQQALIDETCLAAIGLGDHPGTIKIQAIYPNPDHPGRTKEGTEFPVTMEAVAGYGSIATESRLVGQAAQQIRIHYNRSGNDDYCGSLDLPVPVVPQGAALEPTDQTAYASAFLAIRPELAAFAQKLALTIDGAVKAHAASTLPETMTVVPEEGAPPPPPPPPAPPIEVPQIELPVSAWDALIDQLNTGLQAATDQLQHRYIDGEIQQDYSEASDPDWIWAGTLFFKMTRLSHDDLKLRFGTVSASLPNPQILPAEMRSDGVLASCPDLRSDVFLPDYNCRPEGREATLIIKTAQQVLHTLQSQRLGDALAPIDAGPAAERKTDLLSGNLIAASRLDTVVGALAQSVDGNNPARGDHFDSMFGAVNIGNALYLSASALFHAASQAGATSGNGVASLVLSLFACLIVVPGFFLAVYLPLLPALRFFLGIATWLITVFEALVALPLIALVQLRTQGEGILSHGRQGWFMLLQMVLRPALMIFGLMAAIIIFDVLYSFITWGIWSALLHISADANQFGNGIEGMVELLGYLIFWSLLVYLAANLSFNAITAIPERILVWIGSVEVSGGAQAVTAGGGQPSPLPLGGGAAPAISITGPAAATLVAGSASPIQQQIGNSPGPAGAQGPSGDAMGANVEHFPRVSEVHIPEGPAATTMITDGAGPRVIPGKPKTAPREEGAYIPPVDGGPDK